MPKRPNPFGDDSPLQYKSHITNREVDMGVNKTQHMQSVYERTRKLLFSGSKSAGSSPCKDVVSDWGVSAGRDELPSRPLPGQMTLDLSGALYAATSSSQPEPANRQCEDQEDMDVGNNNNNNDLPLPRGQMLIDPSGHLCSAAKHAATMNALRESSVSSVPRR